MRYLVKHVSAGLRAQSGAPSQHGLFMSPLLLGLRELSGGGQGSGVLLLHRLRAVELQTTELILRLGQLPLRRDRVLHTALLTQAQGRHALRTGL